MLNNNLIDIEYIKNQIKNSFTKKIFSGSTSSGNASQINTTWEELGKFKTLTIELYKSNTNIRTTVEIPYFMISNGNNLNENKRITNIVYYFYLDDIKFAIHMVPGYTGTITSNSITFDSYASEVAISSMWVNY